MSRVHLEAGPFRPVTTTSGTAGPIQLLLDRVGYKPGWMIRYADRPAGVAGVDLNPEVVIEVSAVDAIHGGDILVEHHFPLPAHVEMIGPGLESWFLGWLESRLDAVERHESREFFRFDGSQVRPPEHGPGDPYR